MDKNIFEKVFLDAEKANARRYLEILTEKVNAEEWDSAKTYAEFFLASVTKLDTFQLVSEVTFTEQS